MRGLGVVGQCGLRASAHAAQAQRAFGGVNQQAAKGCAGGGQVDDLGLEGPHFQQVVDRQLQCAALVGLGGEGRRAGDAHRSRCAQGLVECGQVGARRYQPEVLAGKAQALHDGLGHRHLLGQRAAVVGGFFVGHQHPDLVRALGKSAEPEVQAHAGGVPQGHRQHPGWHAVQGSSLVAGRTTTQGGADSRSRHAGRPAAGGAAQRFNHPGTGLLAVQQQRRLTSTGLGIGRQHRAQLPALVRGPGVGKAHRAAGAHRAARAAAHAQMRFDDNAAALARGRRRRGQPGDRASALAGELALE